MACKNMCELLKAKNAGNKEYSNDPDLRRCSECEKIFHRDNWKFNNSDCPICPCCGTKLKGHSMSKIARIKRDVNVNAKRY